MKNFFFFTDAETDGLYGNFLSVAALVTDKNGNEIERFYGAVKTDMEDLQSTWVKENVYPHLENADVFFNIETDLLETFWSFWIKYEGTAECVAYVPYPVESRLFSMCVMQNIHERQFLAPFPIYDLATLLESKGYNFDCDMKDLSNLSLSCHDAMDDVLMMAKVWLELFKTE